MTNLQELQALLQKVNNIKLDQQSIQNFISSLKDPQKFQHLKSSANNFLRSSPGLWAASIGLSALTIGISLPYLLGSLIKTQALIKQYEQEYRSIPELQAELARAKKMNGILETKEQAVQNLLVNSDRIIFFPEVIRRAAEQFKLQLIVFRPLASEEYNTDSNEDNEPIEDGSNSTDPFLQDGQEIDQSYDAENSTDYESTPPQLETDSYSIQLQGDYLDVLAFLREIQSYQSLIGFQSVSFSQSVGSGIGGSVPFNSTTGAVLAEVVLQLPTKTTSSTDEQNF